MPSDSDDERIVALPIDLQPRPANVQYIPETVEEYLSNVKWQADSLPNFASTEAVFQKEEPLEMTTKRVDYTSPSSHPSMFEDILKAESEAKEEEALIATADIEDAVDGFRTIKNLVQAVAVNLDDFQCEDAWDWNAPVSTIQAATIDCVTAVRMLDGVSDYLKIQNLLHISPDPESVLKRLLTLLTRVDSLSAVQENNAAVLHDLKKALLSVLSATSDTKTAGLLTLTIVIIREVFGQK